MKSRRVGLFLAAGWLSSILVWSQSSPPFSAPPQHQQDAEIVKLFESKVNGYMDLRKKEAGKTPKPTNSTTKLAETRKQMAARVRALRANAHQGDIFTPEITEYFRRQIAGTMAGPRGGQIRASLKRAEPLKGGSPQINEQYPQHVPLQSTPPSLLMNLPTLPKELEYRIVGRDLVLRDSAPNIVIDFIPNVVPQS